MIQGLELGNRTPRRFGGAIAIIATLAAAWVANGAGAAPPAATTSAPAPAHSCCRPGAAAAAAGAVPATELEVPDLVLTRADGATVRLRDELDGGKPVLLNFIFTTCTTICPVMSATFEQVQANLGAGRDRVRMVSISVDPEHDTPERLRAYARAHNAGPEWHFLTGTPAGVEAAQRAFGAYRGNKFNHAAVTYLRAPHEAKWVTVSGLKSAEELGSELRRLGTGEKVAQAR